MDSYLDSFAIYFEAGGPLMLPLAALSVYIYYTALETLFKLRRFSRICGDDASFETVFLNFANEKHIKDGGAQNSAAAASSLKNSFAYLRIEMLAGVDRRLKMIKVLSAAAPLLGLLGTVSGMMMCIGGSAAEGAAQKVAEGVSTALITTQTGLSIALPALVLAMAISSQMQKLLIILSRREGALIRKGAWHGLA